MYHSVIIGGYNTWNEWHLVPAERPTISAPQLKARYEEVEGLDGSLDFSEALDGLHYENRTGSIDFWAIDTKFGKEIPSGALDRLPGESDETYNVRVQETVEEYERYYGTWQELYKDIVNKIQGKKVRFGLEDDDYFFYEGRTQITSVKTEESYVVITIEYNLDPKKYYTSVRITSPDFEWRIWVNQVMYRQRFKIMDGESSVTKILNNPTGGNIHPIIMSSKPIEVSDDSSNTIIIYPGAYCTGDSIHGYVWHPCESGHRFEELVVTRPTCYMTFTPYGTFFPNIPFIDVYIDYSPGGHL